MQGAGSVIVIGVSLSTLPRRYVLVALCAAALFVAYTDRVNLSVAILVMQDRFGWSETMKGLVMSAFFVGYLIFQIPGAWLANRFGGRRVLGIAVLWWSLFTLLTPAAAMWSLPVLLMARIALGLGEAAAFPATYTLFSQWIPVHERSRAVAAVTGGVILGTLAALLTTGIVVARFGWEMAFYGFGVLGILWTALWLANAHESPAAHPGISAEELALFPPSLSYENDIAPPVPWRQILTRPPVWALIVNHFCVNWTLYVLLAWLPSYFARAQSVAVAGSGLYSVTPWVTMFIVVGAGAWLADALITRGVATAKVRKAMQVAGLSGAAVFLLLSRDAASALHAVVLLSLAMGMLGLCYSGFGPNHLEIAPRHADVLFGVTNTFATIPGVVGVAITGWLVDVSGTYSSAFLLAAGINCAGALIWLSFSDHKPIVG